MSQENGSTATAELEPTVAAAIEITEVPPAGPAPGVEIEETPEQKIARLERALAAKENADIVEKEKQDRIAKLKEELAALEGKKPAKGGKGGLKDHGGTWGATPGSDSNRINTVLQTHFLGKEVTCKELWDKMHLQEMVNEYGAVVRSYATFREHLEAMCAPQRGYLVKVRPGVYLVKGK